MDNARDRMLRAVDDALVEEGDEGALGRKLEEAAKKRIEAEQEYLRIAEQLGAEEARQHARLMQLWGLASCYRMEKKGIIPKDRISAAIYEYLTYGIGYYKGCEADYALIGRRAPSGAKLPLSKSDLDRAKTADQLGLVDQLPTEIRERRQAEQEAERAWSEVEKTILPDEEAES